MKYQLITIEPDEIGKVHEIIKICGQDMKSKLDLDHLVPPYPMQSMQKDAKEREVYAVIDSNQILATFTISTEPLEYYNKNIY